MRGGKSFKKFVLIVAVLIVGVVTCFAFNGESKKVFAEDNSIYNRSYASQEYDDGVIFSVEQVYFDQAGDTSRTDGVYYDESKSKSLTNILGYNDSPNYFANYKGVPTGDELTSANDVRSKKIVYAGDFVMVDDLTPMTAYKEDSSVVSLKQGIMMTLGGYVAEKSDSTVTMHTNSEKESKLTYVSIVIKRDGKDISNSENSGVSLRTYNDGQYFDFVYFLDCKKENEGYYELEINYTLDGKSGASQSFDFYMLLKSSYSDPVEINGQSYATYPKIDNAEFNNGEYYQFVDQQNMPILNYDYKHFNLSYKYQVNDVVTSVEVEYVENKLRFTSTTNGVTSQKAYNEIAGNDIVSLLFANIGTYEFEFSYVYYYGGERLNADNLDDIKLTLKIHGYEIKYARTDFASASFKKFTVVQNGTILVAVGGYTEKEAEMLSDIELGYIYEIGANTYAKTGTITHIESPMIENSSTEEGASSVEIEFLDKQFTKVPSNYVNTDQGGVWFNLNDEYVLTGSYYVYSNIAFKTGIDFSTNNFQKDTTFTKLGYYFVCVNYKCSSKGSDTQTQYFAFRISSSTPNVQIMTTENDVFVEENEDGRIYSNQFTNKNVYAKWDNPTTFESQLEARLYYASKSANPYPSKEAMLRYAKGEANVGIEYSLYTKNTLLKTSGSYMLEMRVKGNQTKVYYYFVIDKESISGIETLGVSSAHINSNLIYTVASDASGAPLVYTDSLAINKNFAMWWDDKASGAKITAKYVFAPIVYNKQTDEATTVVSNGKEEVYLYADYKLGNWSSKIAIEKPSTKYSVIDNENVLTRQGVYWFYLEDEAGNTMNYMVILDDTEAKFVAKTKSGVQIGNGETASESVTIDWGTHKVVLLQIEADKLDEFVGSDGVNYYRGDASNYGLISSMFKGSDKLDLYIANEKAIVDCLGSSVNISSETHAGTLLEGRLDVVNWHKVVINPEKQVFSYTINVFGANQKYSTSTNNYFTITLNTDKAEGRLLSKADETTEDFANEIRTYNDEYDEEKLKREYMSGQASDDGFVVFQWINGEGTEYEVSEVYYEYYPLMTQEELNNYNSSNEQFDFYPYSKTSSKYYIYGGENNAQNYSIVEYKGKTVYRSHYINAGYVAYYDGSVKVSKNATLPGLYIVTRKYKTVIEDSNDAFVRNYVFAIDRNNIIDYSTDTNQKTVGQYIDWTMQDSLVFSSFTQAIETVADYSLYLETNKLPLEVRVPTGKYASKSGNNIKMTSNSISGGLKFSIRYYDNYNYLGGGANLSFILFNMSDMQKTDSQYDKGYITYKLDTSSLYIGDDNGGWIARYLKACNKNGTSYLSLPGTYVITIYDNVGIQALQNKTYEMEDCNSITLGVKITQEKPSINAYAGNNVDQIEERSSYVEAELNDDNIKFDTNKMYVMYELPDPDDTKTKAQIDSSYIYVTRTDLSDGTKELYYNSKTNEGKIDDQTQLNGVNDISRKDGKTIIWLDTGVEFENGQVKEYKEYQYEITVMYQLYNGDIGYYTYNVLDRDANIDGANIWYVSEFVITIDRTPILENLNNIIDNGYALSQKEFLTNYIDNLLKDLKTSDMTDEQYKELVESIVGGKLEGEKIFNTVAYYTSGEINYAVVNKLYYYMLNNNNSNYNLANYAIMVNASQNIDLSLGRLYYHKITETNKNIVSLLNITDSYTMTGYKKFNKDDLGEFKVASSANNSTWKTVLTDGDGYYEIVEIDSCGNYTQYVVYLGDFDTIDVVLAENDKNSYKATLKYVALDESNIEFVSELAMSKIEDKEETKLNAFSVGMAQIYYVVDMFGNKSYATTKDNIVKAFGDTDYYYKVNISFNTQNEDKQIIRQNETMFGGMSEYNVADWIIGIVNFNGENNYEITIGNRFNQTLTFVVNVASDIDSKSLNLDSFVVEKEYVGEETKYYLEPKVLNSTKDNFVFYASKIVLRDITDNAEKTYELNSEGVIIKIDDKEVDDASTRIYLATGHYYTAEITDCYGKIATKEKLFAGTGAVEHEIVCEGGATVYNNIYYTSSRVKVSYDKNLYGDVRVKIYKNGAFIADVTTASFGEDGYSTYLSKITKSDNTASFYLYPENTNRVLLSTGAQLEYVVEFLVDNVSGAQSCVFIDNRTPTLSLVSESGEDKSNIVRVDNFDYLDFESLTDKEIRFDAESLFNLSPTLTLSQTVNLNWEDYRNIAYANNEFTYFATRLWLYEFDTKTDYKIVNVTEWTDMYKWMSPKENSIGRYVFVYGIYNQNGQLLMFKTFAFNITSTANAMYEVQNTNGEVQAYDSYISGVELLSSMTTVAQNTMKNRFGLTDVNSTEYKKFASQNIPVYITNETFNLVPNGDNGVTYILYEGVLTDEYSIQVYQVSNTVHKLYVVVLNVAVTSSLTNNLYFVTKDEIQTELRQSLTATIGSLGYISMPKYYKGNMPDSSNAESLVQKNELYLEVYYRFSDNELKYVGKITGDIDDKNRKIEFKTAGSYKIYLKDIAGNTHIWGVNTLGNDVDYLILNIVPEVLVSVNGDVPVDYAYYNNDVTISVCFKSLYDNNSTTIEAYKNGSLKEYITTDGGRKTNYLDTFTFSEYGTYKVVVRAKRNSQELVKTIIFSIINAGEARLALDFTSISKYSITKVTNATTGSDVTEIFNFLLNEGFIYSKLITYERLSDEKAFGTKIGKQTFEVEYLVNNDPLVPIRKQVFRFTINNQTPSMQCSLNPGESTTKDVTLKLNPQIIYSQVGDCYIMVNNEKILTINEEYAPDKTTSFTISGVGDYYIRIVSDSGRVISSFQVTIKEPLNTWSIVLIVAVVLVVIAVITIFIVLRTKMKVR